MRSPRSWLVGLRGRARMRRATARVLAVIVLGSALVGVGVGLLLVGIVNLRSSADATQRSSALLEQVITVEGSVVNAETGLRGYIITGASIFLAPLRTAQAALPAETSRLLMLGARDHDLPAARRLGADARGFLTGYVQHTLRLMRADPAGARTYAVTLTGKRLVDAIRGQASGLEVALSAQQAARTRDANGTAGDDITYGVIILVALVLLTLLIEGVFGRLLLSREAALRRSRETSRMLQTSLLPLAIPELPSCRLAIRFTPAGAGGLVGGDFYDVFALDAPNRWAVVVGDVCGKGAEAAATTAVARWTLRSGSLLTATPTDALRHLNEVMRRRRPRFLFATIVYLLLEIDADELRVTVVCAGHPPPIVLAPGRPPTAVSARGDLVGVWPALRLTTAEVRLAPGELIVAYTDGATDFSSGPHEPLERFLGDVDATTPESVAAAIEGRALSGRPTPRDDIAVVAIRFDGVAATTVGDDDAGVSVGAGEDPGEANVPSAPRPSAQGAGGARSAARKAGGEAPRLPVVRRPGEPRRSPRLSRWRG